jgi:hypothetical protein
VVEKMIDKYGDYGFDLHRINNARFSCSFGGRDWRYRSSDTAISAPLAICRAALQSIGV